MGLVSVYCSVLKLWQKASQLEQQVNKLCSVLSLWIWNFFFCCREEWREDLKKGELCCFWNSQENGKKETAQVEHFQLFLGHRLTYISMTVRFHCQISDCDTLSVLVTDILVGQCKQHTWTWIGWWLLRSSKYYGVWKEFIKGRCYETEALCIINSIWLEFRKLFKLLSGSGPRFRLALY